MMGEGGNKNRRGRGNFIFPRGDSLLKIHEFLCVVGGRGGGGYSHICVKSSISMIAFGD